MRHGAWRGTRVATAAASAGLVLVAALTGCSSHDPAPEQPVPSSSTQAAAYDPSLPAAQAVLALVPAGATELAVTDFAKARLALGATDDTTFWAQAEKDSPLLVRGMLRPDTARLREEFALSQDDVLWEARFRGKGREGWALRLRDGLPMARVRRAVEARVGQLDGAQVRAADHLVVKGAAAPGAESWADRRELRELVDGEPISTYVQRGCLAGEPGSGRLQALEAYSVALESTIMTARLGQGRSDLFTRMRLGSELPVFAEGFTGGVSDPSTGRIGYRVVDPAKAADLTLRHRLPFAVCGG